MLGSAELVELAEAKLHGEPVPLEELRRILRPWLRMQEPPDTVVLGRTHFPLLQEELQRVLAGRHTADRFRRGDCPSHRLAVRSMKRRMRSPATRIRHSAWR